jgi:hypothetical protein
VEPDPARVPFGPTQRRPAAAPVPLSTGHPGLSRVVAPRPPPPPMPFRGPTGPGTSSTAAGARFRRPASRSSRDFTVMKVERPCGGRQGNYCAPPGGCQQPPDLRKRSSPQVRAMIDDHEQSSAISSGRRRRSASRTRDRTRRRSEPRPPVEAQNHS